MRRSFPAWHDGREGYRLREVAPMLFVGGFHAGGSRPGRCTRREGSSVHRSRWGGVVTLCSDYVRPLNLDNSLAIPHIHRAMMDGTSVPASTMRSAMLLYQACLQLGVPMLVLCSAGLSRSASLAYGLLRVVHGLSRAEALRRVQVGGYAGRYPMPDTLASAERWARSQGARL